jgi:hypothetical protein
MSDTDGPEPIDRRGLMRRGAGAALLALAGGMAASAGGTDSASAATGDPLIMGQSNSGGTTLVNVPEFVMTGGVSPGPLLFVNSLGTTIPLRLAGAPPAMLPTTGSSTSSSISGRLSR